MPQRDQFVTEESFRVAMRDWFAGQALAGILAAIDPSEGAWDAFAGDAYEAADAMLRRRSGEGSP